KKLNLDFDPEKAQTPPPLPTPAPEAPMTPQDPPCHPDPREPRQEGSGTPTPNPAYPPADNGETMPQTYLLWAVLALVCCCLPAAIVAIIYSAQVSSKFYARDYEGARRCSERAQIWIIVSIVLGIITMALYFPLMLLSPS
ncbi:MAG: CD225/dispanin family protein, partial [Muribaculaceae bacterium]|nr:CD225/dispanin family protein [Muribaculaceae bacterium]